MYVCSEPVQRYGLILSYHSELGGLVTTVTRPPLH